MKPPCRVWQAAALLAAALLGACGGTPRHAEPAASQVVSQPRSARGNPPFYEVFGRRYHVLDSSEGYRQRGVASWYGRDFHGLTTSGGEPYDMYALTAAHPTLPIPTWVEVTHLGNGKRVIVRINDRGPFVGDRIIDLSYRAAQLLDMVNDGTATVEVRALGAASADVTAAAAQPAQPRGRRAARHAAMTRGAAAGLAVAAPTPAATPAAEEPARRMFIQVGAFARLDNAERLVEELKAQGYNSFMVSAGGTDGLHRVRVGPVLNEQEFDRLDRDLRSLGMRDTRLVIEP